jgi:hypothetical protein
MVDKKKEMKARDEGGMEVTQNHVSLGRRMW